MTGLSRVALCLAAAAATQGCGQVCEQVGRQRAELLARRPTASGAPHAVAVLPFGLVNELIEPEVRRIADRPVALSGVGMLAPFLGEARARVDSVVAGAGPGGGLGLTVVVGIDWSGERLFTVTVLARVDLERDPASGRLVAALGADDLASGEVRLAPGAADRAASALRSRLPPVARGLVSAGGLEALASAMASAVLSQTWPVIQPWVAAEIGRAARIEVDLGEIPISRVSMDSTPGSEAAGLALALWTTLPVEAGEIGRPLPAAGGRQASFVAHGAVVAELGNWAMDSGRAPRRFDRQGEAAEDGELEAVLGWRGGERPLEVHLFRLERPCLHAVLVATPEARVEGDAVQVEVADGRLESMEGAAQLRLGAVLTGMWRRTFAETESVARSVELTIGGRPVRAAVESLERDGDLFRGTLALEPE